MDIRKVMISLVVADAVLALILQVTLGVHYFYALRASTSITGLLGGLLVPFCR